MGFIEVKVFLFGGWKRLGEGCFDWSRDFLLFLVVRGDSVGRGLRIRCLNLIGFVFVDFRSGILLVKFYWKFTGMGVFDRVFLSSIFRLESRWRVG